VLSTALNGPILAYAAITFFATLIGYVTGTVRTVTGFFYVSSNEYFVVFFGRQQPARPRAGLAPRRRRVRHRGGRA
jgi:hypothetical protein